MGSFRFGAVPEKAAVTIWVQVIRRILNAKSVTLVLGYSAPFISGTTQRFYLWSVSASWGSSPRASPASPTGCLLPFISTADTSVSSVDYSAVRLEPRPTPHTPFRT